MNILIFDTETTGLPANFKAPMSDTRNWPRLVQLSWIFTNGKERQEFDFIINPKGEYDIPDDVANIHGITNQIANEKGQDRQFVLDIFKGFLHTADLLVAHNIAFDTPIVGAEYHRMYQDNRFGKFLEKKKLYCTMMEAHKMGVTGNHANTKWPKLIELYQTLFNESFDGAHNSLNDSRACERCFFELYKRSENITPAG